MSHSLCGHELSHIKGENKLMGTEQQKEEIVLMLLLSPVNQLGWTGLSFHNVHILIHFLKK